MRGVVATLCPNRLVLARFVDIFDREAILQVYSSPILTVDIKPLKPSECRGCPGSL